MISEVEFDKIFNYWWEDLKWSGVFKINWVFVKDLHHVDVQDIKVSGTPMNQLKDGSRVDFDAGKKMLELFKASDIDSDIFEAFEFMDEREEKLRIKRDSYYEMIKQLKNKGLIPESMKNNNYHKGPKYNGQYKKRNNYKNQRGYKDRDAQQYKQGPTGNPRGSGEGNEYIKKDEAK
jgi:hypothetical protein